MIDDSNEQINVSVKILLIVTIEDKFVTYIKICDIILLKEKSLDLLYEDKDLYRLLYYKSQTQIWNPSLKASWITL